jgi:hypothetical protein
VSAAFTRGPWAVSTVSFGSGKRHNILGRTGKFAIAHTYGDPRPARENEANARLIAAAPDLFEALNAIVAAIEPTLNAAVEAGYPNEESVARMNAAKKALTKARGEAL